jgi:hypothetical protein
MHHHLKNFLIICIFIFLFFIDVASAALFNDCIVQSVMVYYVALLFKKPYTNIIGPHPSVIFFAFFFLALESFLWYGRFGVTLIFLIPATVASIKLKRIVAFHDLVPYALIACCLAVNWFILSPFLLGSSNNTWYTISKIIANISLMILFY